MLHVIAQAQAGMLGSARVVGEHYAEKPLKIVFVSAEVGPWSKTGGLGDVVGERELGAVSGLKHVKWPEMTHLCNESGDWGRAPQLQQHGTASEEAKHQLCTWQPFTMKPCDSPDVAYTNLLCCCRRPTD